MLGRPFFQNVLVVYIYRVLSNDIAALTCIYHVSVLSGYRKFIAALLLCCFSLYEEVQFHVLSVGVGICDDISHSLPAMQVQQHVVPQAGGQIRAPMVGLGNIRGIVLWQLCQRCERNLDGVAPARLEHLAQIEERGSHAAPAAGHQPSVHIDGRCKAGTFQFERRMCPFATWHRHSAFVPQCVAVHPRGIGVYARHVDRLCIAATFAHQPLSVERNRLLCMQPDCHQNKQDKRDSSHCYKFVLVFLVQSYMFAMKVQMDKCAIINGQSYDKSIFAYGI